MFNVLIALGLFVAVVWVVAHAVFLLTRADAEEAGSRGPDDPISTFVRENYGAHYEPENCFSEESLRKL